MTFETSPAQENYLQTIHSLSKDDGVRPSVLATALGVKRASVSKFIGKLADIELVEHVPRGKINLTKKGRVLAESLVRRNKCLQRLLIEVCNMEPQNAGREADRLEHMLSDEVLHRLETLVNFSCSSEAWLKRLHLRMEEKQPETVSPAGIIVGNTRAHQGDEHKE